MRMVRVLPFYGRGKECVTKDRLLVYDRTLSHIFWNVKWFCVVFGNISKIFYWSDPR